jgi:hypothetical protein
VNPHDCVHQLAENVDNAAGAFLHSNFDTYDVRAVNLDDHCANYLRARGYHVTPASPTATPKDGE